VRGTDKNDWLITGRGTTKELTQFEVRYDGVRRLVAGPLTIPFDSNPLALPPKDDECFGGSRSFELQATGTLKVLETGTYDLKWVICLGTKAGIIEDCCLDIIVECPPDPIPVIPAEKTTTLSIDKNTGFEIIQAGPIAYLRFNPQFTPDSVLNFSDLKARWTQSPKFGVNVSLGTQAKGWLKIGDVKTFAWLTNQNVGQSKITLPGLTFANSFLYAESFKDECVTLGWLSPGKTGTLRVVEQVGVTVCNIMGYTCSVPKLATYNVYVRHGLVVGDSAYYLIDDPLVRNLGCDVPDSTKKYSPCEAVV
jgi:hypothetical protein